MQYSQIVIIFYCHEFLNASYCTCHEPVLDVVTPPHIFTLAAV
uniref:Uncharacterized protein n=1 Tax=Rhizophora mucronata TaxID=61149 RepID=A0A2P2J310_RHIMU